MSRIWLNLCWRALTLHGLQLAYRQTSWMCYEAGVSHLPRCDVARCLCSHVCYQYGRFSQLCNLIVLYNREDVQKHFRNHFIRILWIVRCNFCHVFATWPALPTGRMNHTNSGWLDLIATFHFLANVNSSSCSLHVIGRPSVVCRLSVTFVRPTQAIEIFGNISTPFGCTLAICWHPGKILRRSFQGNPSVGGVKHKRGSRI